MGRQTNRSLPKVKVIFSCAFGDFQPRVRPIRRWCRFVFRITFLTCCCFFPQVSPPKKKERMNMKHAFRWQLLVFAVVFCFLKGLGHTARSIDCLHGAIGNLSEDSAPVGVFQSQWSRGASEISAEKHQLWRWLEGAKMCQVPFFFFRGFQGKFHGFNSTRHMLKRLKKKVVLPLLAGWFEEVFGWMPFSWRLTWRKNCETWGCHG